LLGIVVSEKQNDWHDYLPYIAAALRASSSEATGYSANYLMLGREVNTTAASYGEFVENVREKLVFAYDAARERLGVAAARNKRYYDLKAKSKTFAVNDIVYYYNPRKFVGKSDKWASVTLAGRIMAVAQYTQSKTIFTSVL